MTDKRVVLLLAPSSMPQEVMFPGSQIIEATCGHSAWISPTMMEVIEEYGSEYRTQCLTCARNDPATLEAMSERGVHITPKAREALNDALGVSQTDQLMATFNVSEADFPDGENNGS